MELSDETSFVCTRRGMILLSYQPVSVLIWTSLLRSRSVRWESVSHSGSRQSGVRWGTRGNEEPQGIKCWKLILQDRTRRSCQDNSSRSVKGFLCASHNIFNNVAFIFLIILLTLFVRLGFSSQCSRSCGKGLQMREVRCLTPAKKHSLECDSDTKPEQEQICNTIPCSPQVSGWCVLWCDSVFMCVSGLSLPASLSSSLITDENCRDRHHNCVMVVQARLCVYAYYKSACCASCIQSAQRAKRQWPAKHRQPRCGGSQWLGQKGWSPLKWQVCRNGQPRLDVWWHDDQIKFNYFLLSLQVKHCENSRFLS